MQPGFVLKSYILPEGEQKLFVNMCMTDTLDPASVNPVKGSDGKMGENWNVPYSLTPPRDDHDKGKYIRIIIYMYCGVYIVLPHTY